MGGIPAARWLVGALGALATLVSVAPAAPAFEAFDGRLQVHGFFEEQIRGLTRDFNTSDGVDLAQWYHVLNVEVEYDIAQDGWGPFSGLSAYARIEGRYDCVWTRACGIFRSADTYGDRAQTLPRRLIDGRRGGFTGAIETGDTRTWAGVPLDQLGFDRKDFPYGDRNNPAAFFQIPTFSTLLNQRGLDGHFGVDSGTGLFDDPAFIVFDTQVRDCIFGARKVKGSEDGNGTQLMPWNPGCKSKPGAPLRFRANPFNPSDHNAALAYLVINNDDPNADAGNYGDMAALPIPYRPATTVTAVNSTPIFDTGNPADIIDVVYSPAARAGPGVAQGIYYPNKKYAALLRSGRLGAFDQNFRQAELEWNRGASQQDEKELKEAYLDAELLDGRLWFRIGKQNIVWGKTELFRTTDQFNPQDLALASLPSLEESRIALWAIRGIYSFYSVGPLEDVRLELAANFDQMEPVDLGRCGEPYSPNPVCDKTAGLFVHGLTGLGVAGEVRPHDPWNSAEGLEFGARLEFRWDRFSFQFSDFWGYNDFAYADQLFVYERNVDPATGRPREAGSRGSCTTGLEAACLEAGEALTLHHANQHVFAMICATSIGFSSLDRSVCAQSVLNSRVFNGGLPTTELVAALLRGANPGKQVLLALAAPLGSERGVLLNTIGDLNGSGGAANAADLPLVGLVDDDLVPGSGSDGGDPVDPDTGVALPFVDGVLTDEQAALLGCGPFYGTDCNVHGVDLLNAEASAVVQSWPGFEGTYAGWDTRDNSVAQPGTIDFLGGPVCTRYVNGSLVVLPGCRGPQRGLRTDLSAGYDPAIDGTPPDLAPQLAAVLGGAGFFSAHPFTGQLFASEMAALSWNALMGFVALSFAADDSSNPINPDGGIVGLPNVRDPASPEFVGANAPVESNHFDPLNAFRTDGCSFAAVQFCSNIQSVLAIIGVQRDTIRAGGSGRFGRRDFAWHAGSDVVLRYDKRNVLGFAMDFAEDVTKSNWSVETTWITNTSFTNNDDRDGISEADTYNLTVSVDRPTFINFLNANRTFFFNSQWFFQYVAGYEQGFTSNGPFNVLGTFTVSTGYFQDRLLPSVTFVYDVESGSGAALPQVQYRFTEAFSATFGLAGFWGRLQERNTTLTPILPGNRVGSGAYKSFVENGLAAVRSRDEVFLRIRYTF